MKTKFKVIRNYVEMCYVDDFSGQSRTRTFFVRNDGEIGYVKEVDSAGNYPQVCERLAGLGSTLMATVDSLPDVIRHEYRKMRDSERRFKK